MKTPVKAVLVVSALTLLGGCVAVPADTAYYEPAPVYYYGPPAYYYAPAIRFGIYGGYYRHFDGGHHRHGGRRGHRRR